MTPIPRAGGPGGGAAEPSASSSPTTAGSIGTRAARHGRDAVASATRVTAGMSTDTRSDRAGS